MIKVAATIIKDRGKILVCKRGPGGNCAHLWEFPGGKLEEGEDALEAAVRECWEELSVKIVPLGVLDEYSFSYPDRDIYFYFVLADYEGEELLLHVHEDAKWLTPYEMYPDEFCPADRKIIELLRVQYDKNIL